MGGNTSTPLPAWLGTGGKNSQARSILTLSQGNVRRRETAASFVAPPYVSRRNVGG